MKSLEVSIEQLRMKMVKLVGERGNFVDEDVVRISQQLDKMLMHYQRMKQRDNFNANGGVVA